MTQRFLVIKQAYIEDVSKRDSIQQDIESLYRLVKHALPDSVTETCAITDEYEWLLHGREIKPSSHLAQFDAVFICIHRLDKTYDVVDVQVKAHATHSVYLYNSTDFVFHNAQKLAEVIALHGDVSAVRVKVPHQIHVDIESLNTDVVSSQEIARKHLRNLFLPIHVMESYSHDYIRAKDRFQSVDKKRLANNIAEFIQHIDNARHRSKGLTFREYIQSPEVYFISIPNFRNEKIYTSISLVHKQVDSRSYWATQYIADSLRLEAKRVITHISQILFTKQVVVYALSIHTKRGIFVQYTIPLLHFAMQNPDFLIEMAKESGIPIADLFQRL